MSTALGRRLEEITVLDGSTFFRSRRNGDVIADRPQGLFVLDTRVISSWELLLDDQPLEALGAYGEEPFAVTFITRGALRPGGVEPTVVVERRRMVADGAREDIVVHNYGTEALGGQLTLVVDGDFADVFSVKDGRPRPPGPITCRPAGDGLDLSVQYDDDRRRGVRVVGHGGRAGRNSLTWQLAVPAHGRWHTTVEVLPYTHGEQLRPPFGLDRPMEHTRPSRRMQDWRSGVPTVDSDWPTLQGVLDCSLEDLGALRIVDPRRPELDVVAAGAPWFMALFGRDSLITSWLALGWDLGLARGTLHTLARIQGRRLDLLSEEEPGRILHEVRLGMEEHRALGGSSVYYGSVDATPLFVIVLDAAARWGLPAAEIAELLPAADRALQWVEECGDVDGDGFVEYRRKTDRGLRNQGWKDSEDSITFRDGHQANGPIALAEVQAYVYGAYQARARLARALQDQTTAARCEQRALALRDHFDAAFWMPREGHYALALDGDKRQVDSLASNQGHCLWAGIVAEERVEPLVTHLLSPAMFGGWGVRTLAVSAAAYNPVSYHNGSVWPHDNALLVAGLMRYGRYDDAVRVATGIIEAAAHFEGRLPELFCGFSRDELPLPLPYPTSCSPQAWAAATPLGLVTALLAMEPDPVSRTVKVLGRLPAEWGLLRIDGVVVGESRVSVQAGR